MKRMTYLWMILAITPLDTALEAKKAPAALVMSEYTNLIGPPCITTSTQAEGGNSEQICPGIYGHKVLVLDSDGRMSITVTTPDNIQHPLNFWDSVTSHFSSIGRRAEWRIEKQRTKGRPIGIIFPLEVTENPDSATVTLFLVVAKVDHSNVCVVQTIRSSPGALIKARKVADSAAEKPCLVR